MKNPIGNPISMIPAEPGLRARFKDVVTLETWEEPVIAWAIVTEDDEGTNDITAVVIDSDDGYPCTTTNYTYYRENTRFFGVTRTAPVTAEEDAGRWQRAQLEAKSKRVEGAKA